MRVLLLHPDDDIQGSWSRERWDLIVDLGRAPKSFYEEWSRRLGCPVFSVFDFALEVEDLQVWRGLMQFGMGQVVDRLGIDWWDVIGILVQRDVQDLRLALRLADQIKKCQSLTVTRHSLLAQGLSLQLGCPLKVLQKGLRQEIVTKVGRYKRAASNLSFMQLRQVVYDKYDARYAWRRKFSGTAERSSAPVVLLPSAYSNVTRAAFRYAGVLPELQFLLVLARETGAVTPVPGNVQIESLAAFATSGRNRDELRQLENSWDRLENSLRDHAEFHTSVELEVLKDAKRWLHWALPIRDAWNEVFERRSITACMSGDDSNPYTRIPLLLARHRKLPAIGFHHGALDGIMAYKNRGFSTYLVKGEMERDYLERVCKVDPGSLRIGAAAAPPKNQSLWSNEAPWIVFFAEPYETDLWRAEAIYRDVLPRLCVAARQAGKTVVMKLHPFETVRHRQRMLKRVLSEQDQGLVNISAAPLSPELLRKTWCGVTAESTTAFECATVGIPAFLCGWLRHAYVGYARQYARFGVARMLDAPDDLLKIPQMVPDGIPAAGLADRLVHAITSNQFREILRDPPTNGLR